MSTPKSTASPGAASGTTAAVAPSTSASTASDRMLEQRRLERETPVLAARRELLRQALVRDG